MIEIAIMIEGQSGLNWPRWQNFAKAVENLGYVGLYRSDHYTNPNPPDLDSLELWVSLTWLASNTSRIEFGPMVSPLSFRNPSMTARMASAVDDLSNGRLQLGLGAGWQEREHNTYGWDLLNISERFDRFEEGLEIVSQLLKNDNPSSYEGKYYQLREGLLLPRPQRSGGPPLLIGGNGPKRTLPLVAKYAQEWNALFLNPEDFKSTSAFLDELVIKAGRKPEEVKRSMMTSCEFGRTEKEVRERVEKRTNGRITPEKMRANGRLVGTANQIVEILGEMEEAGVERIMLQWLGLDDLDRLEAMAHGVLPQLRK